MERFIGIEAGGTKFICATGNGRGEIFERSVIKTETPAITLQNVIHYIASQQQKTKIAAIGIGCFGPLDLNKHSPHFGHITATPKPGWQYINMLGELKAHFKVPMGFDTDVNCAALAEHHFGAAKENNHFIYITVGTGIGGGVMVNGKMMHGLLHPEMGHIFVPQDKSRDAFPGICPYHKNCLEGLASGSAISARWSVESALDLTEDHKAWDLEAYYLALACANYSFALSPQKIILGGGIMQQQHLFAKIHAQFPVLLNDYLRHAHVKEKIHDYIVPAKCGENAGVLGALLLAQQTYALSGNELGKIYEKPWGNYQTLAQENGYQVKILTVLPQGRLSLQKHFKRSEHWVVARGMPTLTVNHFTKTYQVDDCVYIPKDAVHRIENFSQDTVKLIEVQVGDYLGEDDIVRLEDVYGRDRLS